MSILKVLNVGQGDSMIVTPKAGCCHAGKKLFIDLGPGQYDITQQITSKDKIHIFITHHDIDHMGGLKFFVGKMDQVEEITVPFYQNEITLIAKSILGLKGIRCARDCGEFIRLLEDILANQAFLKSIITYSQMRPCLSFAYEGQSFCDHIKVLNPPITNDALDWEDVYSKNNLSSLFDELYEPHFARCIGAYFTESSWGNNYEGETSILDLILPDSPEAIPFEQSMSAKRTLVLNYILHNIQLFRAFNANPSRANMRKIYLSFALTAHDVCMVLRLNYDDKTFLLTGDASKEVFTRLINEGENLSAEYFKIPHHGSKKNISKKILTSIHPVAAIISHDNRTFGKAQDSHPNTAVLNLLEQHGITIMLTNDVVKKNAVLLKKANHLGDSFVEIL